MSTPHSSHWLGGPTSMTRNAFTSLCWSSPVSCDACGWKWNPKPETRTNQVALVSFTHCWNRGLHSLVWAKPDLYATPGTSRLKNLCILIVDLLKAYHINHIIFIVHLSTNLPEDLVERWKGRRKSSTICGTLGWGIHLEKKTLGIEPATTAVRIPTNCRLLKKSWIFEFV